MESLLGSGDDVAKVPQAYLRLGLQSLKQFSNNEAHLLLQGKIPAESWSDLAIESLIMKFSLMDSNNFESSVGVGEREGRIYSDIVARRHFRMSHGIGRSGDVTAVQPKAAGSSLVCKLANSLVLDFVKVCGVKRCKKAIIVPVATGMALMMCMLFLRQKRPSAKYVIWPRIDQKSCFKSMLSAGLEPVVIEPRFDGDELRSDLEAIESNIKRIGAEDILCVMTTTSCFAPRSPDSIDEIAEIASKFNIPHVVNNAYGLQSSKCCHLVNEGSRIGRVDFFVQSTDKNLMVPVGGSIIGGFDEKLVEDLAKSYPGRASGTPSMDVLITLLKLGVGGTEKLLSERKDVFVYLQSSLADWAERVGERVLVTSKNQISLAVSLSTLDKRTDEASEKTKLGSMLFSRCCSGVRVVPKGVVQSVQGHEFVGFGAHCKDYGCSYLNAAAAVGMTRSDVDVFLRRLNAAWKHAGMS